MHFIAHRINTAQELRDLPREYGAEVDLRDRGERLILQHDPFKDGEDFERYLETYRHGTLILNIKSERIEPRVQALVRQAGITDYFFLDSSFPMIHQLSSAGERKIALRYSEYEGLDTILAMKGRVDWVWVDCFTRLPVTRESHRLLKDAGFKLCLVSPELQGRDADIEAYRSALAAEQIVFDAICTKHYNIGRWKG